MKEAAKNGKKSGKNAVLKKCSKVLKSALNLYDRIDRFFTFVTGLNEAVTGVIFVNQSYKPHLFA